MIDYQVKSGSDVVDYRISDEIDVDEILASVEKFVNDSSLPENPKILVDATELDPHFSFEELKGMSESIKKFVDDMPFNYSIAVFASSRTVLASVEICSVILSLTLSPIHIHGFRDKKSAEEWLRSTEA